MFVFPRRSSCPELERLAPQLRRDACPQGGGRSRRATISTFIRLHKESFAACPGDLDRLRGDGAYRPRRDGAARCGWSDVGSWGALWQIGAQDEHGNVVPRRRDPARRREYLHARRIAAGCAVGYDDVVIVETADAMLVAPTRMPRRT
jgi:mannose-1-phosphate guanylyltransferase/mannose-6-phosphate isomerase